MSSNIHPTAIVHPEAKLGENVQIGPYAIIEGPAQIGDNCVIQAHAIVTGHVRMGCNNFVGYGALVGGDPQDYAFKTDTESWVVIGDNNRIREYVTIHRGTGQGTETRVGNNCFLMGGTHLAHNVVLGDRVVIANNALLAGYVQVQDGVFIGGGAVFHQFIRIGRLAIIRGGSSFGKDVPPFLVGAGINRVGGMNVIGLRRNGFNLEQRKEIKEAFKLLYKSGLNTNQALEAAGERQWGPDAAGFFQFVREAKKRGICSLMSGKRGEGDSAEE